MMTKNNFYIITGGPGAGKTTLLDELRQHNYKCVPEVAREIINDQMAHNGNALPWKDAKAYSRWMLSFSVRDFVGLSETDETCFFDRGIPDTWAYERLMDFKYDKALYQAVHKYRYNKTVFFLPPWQ